MYNLLNIHPRNTNFLYQHNNILEEIIGLYNNNKLHHAYLLSGNYGVGKATFAYILAKILLSDINCNKNITINNTYELPFNKDSINAIENQIHPNLLIVEPEWDEKNEQYKNIISIDAVRNIKKFLYLSTYSQNNLKIIIIDSIDYFNSNAANALLKILEEPNKNTLFLLISHNSQEILDTIQSRCINYNFKNLSNENINNIIKKLNLVTNLQNNTNIEDLLVFAEGSIGKLLWFFDENHLKAYNIAKTMLEAKNYSLINSLLEITKEFNFKDFKFFLHVLIYFLIPINLNNNSNNYLDWVNGINKILNLSKNFNLEQQSIIIYSIFNSI